MPECTRKRSHSTPAAMERSSSGGITAGATIPISDLWNKNKQTTMSSPSVLLQPHEIDLSKLGPGTKEACGISASTKMWSQSAGNLATTVVVFGKRLKPCLKRSSESNSTSSTSASSGTYGCVYQPPRPARSVRFSTSSKRGFPTLRYELKPVARTDEEVGASWWSSAELKEINIRETALARAFLLRCTRYPKAMERLLRECFMAAKLSPVTKCDPDDIYGYPEALRAVVGKGYRGFEQALLGRMEFPSKKRCYRIGKRCIVALMKAQTEARQSGANATEMAAILASHQQPYSLFAAKFAQILAEGDEIIAGKVQGNRMRFVQTLSMRLNSSNKLGKGVDEDFHDAITDSIGRLVI